MGSPTPNAGRQIWRFATRHPMGSTGGILTLLGLLVLLGRQMALIIEPDLDEDTRVNAIVDSTALFISVVGALLVLGDVVQTSVREVHELPARPATDLESADLESRRGESEGESDGEESESVSEDEESAFYAHMAVGAAHLDTLRGQADAGRNALAGVGGQPPQNG
jgi:hypothetical protein